MSTTGFIIDAPNALILSGNDVYGCVTADSGQVQLTGSTIEIKGGWDLNDLMTAPSGTKLEVTLSNAKFDTDYFKMATASIPVTGETIHQYKFGNSYTVDDTAFTITINDEVETGSLKIAGMTETTGETPATGEYKVTTATGTTTVLFNTEMAGKSVVPAYSVAATGGESYAMTSDSIPKKGKMILQFPVYDAKEDASYSNICQLTIYRAALEQNMTMGGKYKTASTFELKATGLSSGRDDKRIFQADIIPVTATT